MLNKPVEIVPNGCAKCRSANQPVTQSDIKAPKPMFYVEVAEGGPWLAQDITVTDDWDMRGLWATEEQAAAARYKSLDTETGRSK
jgi:hypothetical protein